MSHDESCILRSDGIEDKRRLSLRSSEEAGTVINQRSPEAMMINHEVFVYIVNALSWHSIQGIHLTNDRP